MPIYVAYLLTHVNTCDSEMNHTLPVNGTTEEHFPLLKIMTIDNKPHTIFSDHHINCPKAIYGLYKLPTAPVSINP